MLEEKRKNEAFVEAVFLGLRYITYLVLLAAVLLWLKQGMYFGFVLAFSLLVITVYSNLKFRNTKIYRLYHSTNKDLFKNLLLVYSQNKNIVTYGTTEEGFFMLEETRGIRFEYYLPYGRRKVKHLYKIKSYVEDMEYLTDKYNADYSVFIMEDKIEFKIWLFRKMHPEYNFELWSRRSACQYAALNEAVGEKRA